MAVAYLISIIDETLQQEEYDTIRKESYVKRTDTSDSQEEITHYMWKCCIDFFYRFFFFLVPRVRDD